MSQTETLTGFTVAPSVPTWPSRKLPEDLEYAVIGTIPEMRKLRADWMELERASGEPLSYFQSYDWCMRWCETLAAGPDAPRVRILTIRVGGRIALILPMMVARTHFQMRKLTFLGEPHTQYGNVLVNRDLISPEIAMICWQKFQAGLEADAITLRAFPAGGFLAQMVGAEPPADGSGHETSMMDLRRFGSAEEYRAALPKKARRRHARRRNRLAGLGELKYEVHPGGSVRYAGLVATAMDMKRQWLAETGRRPGIMGKPASQTFLQSLRGDPDTLQGAFASALTLNRRPIAVELAFCKDGHYYAYIGAFEWSLRAYSPGKVQMEEALHWIIDNGLNCYDLLGSPTGFKADWSNQTIPLSSHAIPLTTKGWTYSALWLGHVRPGLKNFLEALPVAARKTLVGSVTGQRSRNGQAKLAPRPPVTAT